MSARTAVYRLYDDADRLLYVGAGKAPQDRFRYHAKYKRWWPEVARMEVHWHEDRDTALRAEAEAITAEGPLYNAAIPLPDGSVRGSTVRTDLPEIARNSSPPAPPDMRYFRVSDDDWFAFRAKAEMEGRTASEAMTEALRSYAYEDAARSYDFTFANWPEAAEWAGGHLGALRSLGEDLDMALGPVPAEWLAVAAWLASTHHAGDPAQQKRVITGHILRRFDVASVRSRYRDSRHLSETVQAILAARLPLAGD